MVNSKVQVEKILIFNVLKTANERFSLLPELTSRSQLVPVITCEIISKFTKIKL